MHPALRDDLELHSASSAFDGAPQWTIHDPVRNLFFFFYWITFEFLARWNQGNPEDIIRSIHRDTTLAVTSQDYEEILQFLIGNELIQINGDEGLDYLRQQSQAKKPGFINWIIHNYLFFRIPLFKTDAWLEKHINHVSLFFSPVFFKITFVIGCLGLFEIYNHFSDFSATFLDMFSWQGAAAYFLALVGVKFFHEFAHAFTAKRLGCRVPTMGVAFLVMMPVAYTDTNDVWKLSDHKSRLKVDVAGVVAELVIAAWAIFFWSLLPPGLLKNIFYILGTTSWINTIFVNLSPFMRFDGYYALSDFLKVGNLHARAFNLAKWHFRKHAFGLNDPIPEDFPEPLKLFLIAFAWVTATYRLIVFLSIAFLVYHFFIKVVGIILFLIEIVWFVGKPIYSELEFWLKRRQEIVGGSKRHRAFYIAVISIFILVLPLDFRLKETGVLKPVQRHYIFAGQPAQLLSMLPANGQQMKAGQELIHLDSPEINRQFLITEQEKKLFEWKVGSASFDADLKNNLQANIESLHMAESNRSSQESFQKQLNLNALFSGQYFELSPDVKAGDWIGKGAKLGVLVNPSAWLVETYIPEEDVHRLAVGNSGKFFPDTAGNEIIKLQVASIDPHPTEVLTDTIYATQMGGSVVSRMVDGKAVADRPYYRVILYAQKPVHFSVTQRGRILIFAKPQSILTASIRQFMLVARREFSF